MNKEGGAADRSSHGVLLLETPGRGFYDVLQSQDGADESVNVVLLDV